MKRIFSLMLCITLIAGMFSFTYADDYKTPSDFEEMKGLLGALGITEEGFDASERKITRGEYTALVVKASGLSAYLGDTVIKDGFSDVTAENPYSAYIAMAKQRGIAFGYSDGTFRSDETVSFAEAVVYLTRLMGYTDVAEARGGFPTGYLVTAESIGITKGVNMPMDAALTSAAAVHLIFNALESEVMAVESWTLGSDSFTVSKGARLMYQSFGIEIVKGVMDEVDLSALIGPNELPPYSVSVDGVLLDIGRLTPNNLLGYYVNAYYKNENGMNVLVYVCADSKKNNVKTVNIAEITDISNQTVTATDNSGKDMKFNYKKGAAILYNGVATKSFFNTSIYLDSNGNRLSGYIEFIDNNGDGVADVVSVNAYEEFIAGKKNTAENILYDINNPSNSIVADTVTNDPYTIIFDEEGEEIPLTKIKQGMSVVVFRSKPDAYQGYIKILVSSETVSGVLEGIGEDEKGATVIIGGKNYIMTDYAVKYCNSALSGKRVVASVNAFGEVCFISEAKPGGTKTGLLKGIAISSNGHEPTGFYIYSEDGKDEILEPAKWVKLDNREKAYNGESIADMQAMKGIIETAASLYPTVPKGSERINTVIKYSVNDEGKLTAVDTVLNSKGEPSVRNEMISGDSLIAVEFLDAQCVVSAGYNVLGNKITVDKTKKVIFYPDDDGVNGYFASNCESVFNNTGKYTGVAYYTDKNSIKPDLFVMHEAAAYYYHTSSSGYTSIVVKMTDTIDDDGMPVKKLYLYHNNQSVVYICDPTLKAMGEKEISVKDLNPGDIIYCAINKLTDKLESFYLRYDAENGLLYNNDTTANKRGQTLSVGYPYLSNEKGMHYVVTSSPSSVEAEYNSGNYMVAEFSANVPITVFDKSKKGNNCVYAGTADEILSWLEAEDECTKLVMHTYGTTAYTLPRGIYIIREAK